MLLSRLRRDVVSCNDERLGAKETNLHWYVVQLADATSAPKLLFFSCS